MEFAVNGMSWAILVFALQAISNQGSPPVFHLESIYRTSTHFHFNGTLTENETDLWNLTVHYSECVPFDGSPPASPGECNVTFIPTTASTYALYFPVQLSDMVPGKAYRWEIGYGYLEPPNFDEFNESFSDICVSSATLPPENVSLSDGVPEGSIQITITNSTDPDAHFEGYRVIISVWDETGSNWTQEAVLDATSSGDGYQDNISYSAAVQGALYRFEVETDGECLGVIANLSESNVTEYFQAGFTIDPANVDNPRVVKKGRDFVCSDVQGGVNGVSSTSVLLQLKQGNNLVGEAITQSTAADDDVLICVTTINDAAGVNSANAFYALEKEIDYEGRKFSKKASVDKGVLDFTEFFIGSSESVSCHLFLSIFSFMTSTCEVNFQLNDKNYLNFSYVELWWGEHSPLETTFLYLNDTQSCKETVNDVKCSWSATGFNPKKNYDFTLDLIVRGTRLPNGYQLRSHTEQLLGFGAALMLAMTVASVQWTF